MHIYIYEVWELCVLDGVEVFYVKLEDIILFYCIFIL